MPKQQRTREEQTIDSIVAVLKSCLPHGWRVKTTPCLLAHSPEGVVISLDIVESAIMVQQCGYSDIVVAGDGWQADLVGSIVEVNAESVIDARQIVAAADSISIWNVEDAEGVAED